MNLPGDRLDSHPVVLHRQARVVKSDVRIVDDQRGRCRTPDRPRPGRDPKDPAGRRALDHTNSHRITGSHVPSRGDRSHRGSHRRTAVDVGRPRMRVEESSAGMTTHHTHALTRLHSLGYTPGIDPSTTRLPSATRLWLEWHDIAGRRRTVAHANSWGLPGEPIHHLDEMIDRAGYGQDLKSEECDAYMSQLAAVAKTDELACRIVIQRILPGIIAVSLRRGRIVEGGAPQALDDMLSAAWVIIRNFPIDRRPRRVAANVLRDMEYLAFVRDTRSKRHRTEMATDNSTILSLGTSLNARGGAAAFGVLVASDSSDPTADAAEFACVMETLRERGLRPIDERAFDEMLTDRQSPESAKLAGISPRALRDRRQTAIARARHLLGIEISA